MKDPVTWGLAASTWDVIGTLLTAGGLLSAGIAALVAALQYRASKDARLDQTRPYVLVSAELSEADTSIVEILVRNIGNGPAFDVTIEFVPALVGSRDEETGFALRDARIFNEPTPMMPPGYEARLYFDSSLQRRSMQEDPDADPLPDTFEAFVTYHDGRGHSWSQERNVVDLGAFRGMLWTVIYTQHHSAKALREIEKHVKKLAGKAGQVEATIETRDERAARHRQESERHEEAIERWRQRGLLQERSDDEEPPAEEPPAEEPQPG